jgi:LmbE family N-acetylglucosaminyl deacetylase
MITPIVEELEWRRRLDGLPLWEPPRMDTLVISPHPDDETLGAGGLIASLCSQGIKVNVVAVTEGENAYDDGIDIREVRELEQNAALARLGVAAASVHRFRMTDSGVAENEQRLIQLLLPQVSETTHVVAPWQKDFHPDHEACGRAAVSVARSKAAPLTSYFFWTWHRGTVELLEGLQLVVFPIGTEERRAKHEALLCHRSQLKHASGEPILPEYLLGPVYWPFEVYLPS